MKSCSVPGCTSAAVQNQSRSSRCKFHNEHPDVVNLCVACAESGETTWISRTAAACRKHCKRPKRVNNDVCPKCGDWKSRVAHQCWNCRKSATAKSIPATIKKSQYDQEMEEVARVRQQPNYPAITEGWK